MTIISCLFLPEWRNVIPFVKAAPIDAEESKKVSKQKEGMKKAAGKKEQEE